MPELPPALRPPEWALKYEWHWVEFPHSQGFEPKEWRQATGQWVHGTMRVSPKDAGSARWRYHGPCDPAAIVPDPDNERQRDAVADAMKQTCFASSWDEQARAVLTALRDLK